VSQFGGHSHTSVDPDLAFKSDSFTSVSSSQPAGGWGDPLASSAFAGSFGSSEDSLVNSLCDEKPGKVLLLSVWLFRFANICQFCFP